MRLCLLFSVNHVPIGNGDLGHPIFPLTLQNAHVFADEAVGRWDVWLGACALAAVGARGCPGGGHTPTADAQQRALGPDIPLRSVEGSLVGIRLTPPSRVRLGFITLRGFFTCQLALNNQPTVNKISVESETYFYREKFSNSNS